MPEVTIIDPSHPLHGQRLAVESLASSRGPAWVTVVLADGRRRQVRRSATDLAAPSAPPVGDGEQRRVSVRTLLPLAHHIRPLLLASAKEAGDGPPDAASQPLRPGAAPPEPGSGIRAAVVAGVVAGHPATAGTGSGRVDPADAGAATGAGQPGDKPC